MSTLISVPSDSSAQAIIRLFSQVDLIELATLSEKPTAWRCADKLYTSWTLPLQPPAFFKVRQPTATGRKPRFWWQQFFPSHHHSSDMWCATSAHHIPLKYLNQAHWKYLRRSPKK